MRNKQRIYGLLILPLTLVVTLLVRPPPAKAWSSAVSGPYRICDATNRDGLCVAWHGAYPLTAAPRCSTNGCDLRPSAHRAPVAPVPVQEREPVQPKVITVK